MKRREGGGIRREGGGVRREGGREEVCPASSMLVWPKKLSWTERRETNQVWTLRHLRHTHTPVLAIQFNHCTSTSQQIPLHLPSPISSPFAKYALDSWPISQSTARANGFSHPAKRRGSISTRTSGGMRSAEGEMDQGESMEGFH